MSEYIFVTNIFEYSNIRIYSSHSDLNCIGFYSVSIQNTTTDQSMKYKLCVIVVHLAIKFSIRNVHMKYDDVLLFCEVLTGSAAGTAAQASFRATFPNPEHGLGNITFFNGVCQKVER